MLCMVPVRLGSHPPVNGCLQSKINWRSHSCRAAATGGSLKRIHAARSRRATRTFGANVSQRILIDFCFQLKFHERARFSMTEIQSQNHSSLLLWLTNTDCLQSQSPSLRQRLRAYATCTCLQHLDRRPPAARAGTASDGERDTERLAPQAARAPSGRSHVRPCVRREERREEEGEVGGLTYALPYRAAKLTTIHHHPLTPPHTAATSRCSGRMS